MKLEETVERNKRTDEEDEDYGHFHFASDRNEVFWELAGHVHWPCSHFQLFFVAIDAHNQAEISPFTVTKLQTKYSLLVLPLLCVLCPFPWDSLEIDIRDCHVAQFFVEPILPMITKKVFKLNGNVNRWMFHVTFNWLIRRNVCLFFSLATVCRSWAARCFSIWRVWRRRSVRRRSVSFWINFSCSLVETKRLFIMRENGFRFVVSNDESDSDLGWWSHRREIGQRIPIFIGVQSPLNWLVDQILLSNIHKVFFDFLKLLCWKKIEKKCCLNSMRKYR